MTQTTRLSDPAAAIAIREASRADMPGIAHVRTSVTENLLTREQLDARGITNESVAASFEQDSKGWVAVEDGRVVAFSIADRASRSIFALFVLPEYEARGLGSRLLDLAVDWLWQNGAGRIWLTTGPGTRAAGFYARCGWRQTAVDAKGELRFEYERA
jgi:GNAT superfamily N-acetyltransferase